ncbi:probable ATP-dependent RNA helicase DHX40, partial [Actinia tenebrosa]|uniref:RNA helicase n=1 Tax=Actinia tenebrosa TaxID=6105 RepID=A0A6P8IS23_ACTTE
MRENRYYQIVKQNMAEKSDMTFGYFKSNSLPIEKHREEIVRAVQNNDFLVIVGETGSGKTTQLSQYLHSAGFTRNGQIIGITQPRRIAAISVAKRVADEVNTTIGREVGYQVRFDDCTSDKTYIKYMTDGCLLKEFLEDSTLSRYAAIILDEAHERSLDTDILFGLVKKFFVGKKGRKNPKVIAMSATLNHQKFAEFLGACPVIEIPGSIFSVKEIYCDCVTVRDLKNPSYLNKVVETVMTIHSEYPPGDILVFLTGQEEIETCCDRLFYKAEKIDYNHDVKSTEVDAIIILPLYGSMTTELQRKVFDPPDPSVRKVVVATNIAATSLTIQGIRYVVDSGFVKQLSCNSRTGLDSLNVVLISRSEAIQRKGRAGRTATGTCFRMYTREVYCNSMDQETVPEIQRTSLSRVVLHLKCMGINDVVRFQYIDPPEERMVLEALKQLYYFGAIDKKGHVTLLGHRMVELPLSPGLSRAVISSYDFVCEELVLPVAAMLSVEQVFASGSSKSNLAKVSRIQKELAEAAGGTNDFATLLYIYKECNESSSPTKWCRDHFVHWRALKLAVTIHHQLENILVRQKLKYDKPRNKIASRSGKKAGR